jgi:hypothetical protein
VTSSSLSSIQTHSVMLTCALCAVLCCVPVPADGFGYEAALPAPTGAGENWGPAPGAGDGFGAAPGFEAAPGECCCPVECSCNAVAMYKFDMQLWVVWVVMASAQHLALRQHPMSAAGLLCCDVCMVVCSHAVWGGGVGQCAVLGPEAATGE